VAPSAILHGNESEMQSEIRRTIEDQLKRHVDKVAIII
jgi:hypothetical protein